MRIAVAKETHSGERRVALVPESAKKLIHAGYEILIEPGTGVAAGWPDEAYRDAGVLLESDRSVVIPSVDIVLTVNLHEPVPAGQNSTVLMRAGAILLGSLMPIRHLQEIKRLAEQRVTAFSSDAIPRSTRAQAMDTLSSMSSIAGYKGALLAAVELNRYFPMLTTAAGLVLPAKVFVIGAGVAGLQAIATARRLGANVTATDVRPEVKEQIESVGAKYVGIEPAQDASAGGGYAKELSAGDRERQQALLAAECAQSDVVITTALIGGVIAPQLIHAETVRSMKKGAVIVDLAADGGGNCELSKPGQTITVDGVTILAPLNLASTVPYHASLLFSRNLTAFLLAFTKDGRFQLDFNDDIQKNCVITHGGEVVHARTREAMLKAGL